MQKINTVIWIDFQYFVLICLNYGEKEKKDNS